MKLDIKKAFYSIFNYNKWLQNLIICCLLFGISQILVEASVVMPYKIIPFISGSLISFILFGYILQTMFDEINDKNYLPLNWVNCLKYLKYGFYINLPVYVYFIPFFFIFLPVQTYFVHFLMKQNISLEFALSIPTSLLMIILYSIFFPYVSAIFAQDFRLKSCFKISYLMLPIKKALPELLISIGISLILFIPYMIFNLLNMLYLDKKITIAFLVFPIYLIIYNLYAQTYKIALNRVRS